MRIYCCAYRFGDVRQFSGWIQKSAENGQTLADDDICYIWDDFVVVKSPLEDTSVLFDDITPEWQEFCTTTLKFEIPADIRQAYEQAATPS